MLTPQICLKIKRNDVEKSEIKLKEEVAVSEGEYTVKLTFLGVFQETVEGIARAGDIKGIAQLEIPCARVVLDTPSTSLNSKLENRSIKVVLGTPFTPVNLDSSDTVDHLCKLMEMKRRNPYFSSDTVDRIYAKALCEMKRRED
jgi:hypothetical protein